MPRRGRPSHPDPDYREKYQYQYRNTVFTCFCGLEIKKGNRYHHQRSKLHEWITLAIKNDETTISPI